MTRSVADVIAITDRLESELIAPPIGEGRQACVVCCDIPDEGDVRCGKCRAAAELLRGVVTPVVPITLYVKPSEMRERLTRYKDRADPEAERLAVEVAALLDRFFLEHGPELSRRYGRVDATVVVPTTRPGTIDHPLSVALDQLPARHVPRRERLLRLGTGTIRRRTPNPDGFVADDSVRGRALMVIDDVYTTGATAQSAACALRTAGARVPAIVVVGRRLNPGVVPEVAELVERQRDRGFNWSRSPWT